ncbi:MAG: glycosyltransferase family 4 protein, partial [Bacteroidetes bacterium]|nr:glycosyltransferase family 4 protein [Bacteroidota bacterium]
MATVISIVSYPFLPARLGGQKGIALFNAYFSKYHKLICVTTKKNDPHAAQGYEVKNILSDSIFRYINVFYFFIIRKAIKENKAGYLIIEHPYYGWLGILLKKFCGVKLIAHSHNLEGLRWKTLGKWWWKILWYYERAVHRHADYNFFIHDEDKNFAIENFRLDRTKCITVTYGIEWDAVPEKNEIDRCKKIIKDKYQIEEKEKILFFNGSFDHLPNREGLKKIIEIVNPLLHSNKDFRYKILISGKSIPKEMTNKQDPNIIFCGFVDDVNIYFKSADIFLNPIFEGGGIKTKLVEALGYNLNAVSTENGAIGVDPEWSNRKLFVCGNNK